MSQSGWRVGWLSDNADYHDVSEGLGHPVVLRAAEPRIIVRTPTAPSAGTPVATTPPVRTRALMHDDVRTGIA
jgi:hypothetical protein